MLSPTGRWFELFVAVRYLRAKRKQAVVSVITVISIIGVTAGVMSLVIALAINAGFRNTLERNLLGATAHVSILEKEPAYGIENWRELLKKVRRLPHVVAASPSLYGQVFLAGPLQSSGAVLKGIDVGGESSTIDLVRHLKQGSLDSLKHEVRGYPTIVIGTELARHTGMRMDSIVRVISPQGEVTPFEVRPAFFRFRVTGIFETGFYDLDNGWAVTSLASAQKVLSLPDVVNSVELKLDDIYAANQVAAQAEKIAGPKYAATSWMEQNKAILNALQSERVVTAITIGLIQLVAALNILVALIMMVMEKHRDISILVSMGARRRQIRRIFMLQGVLIGVLGTTFGLTLGYTLCYFANRYQWVRLNAEVYALSFVPFEPRWIDGLWIAGVAVLVSFLATLYPANSAAKVIPVEALRYE
jgi:lipoprotein-releasing system permease protein